MNASSDEISIVQLALKGTIEAGTPLHHAPTVNTDVHISPGSILRVSVLLSLAVQSGFSPISFSVFFFLRDQ